MLSTRRALGLDPSPHYLVTMFYNTWQLARMLARASESGYYKVHRHHGRTSLESDIMDFWGNLQVQAQKCADNVDDL